MHQIQLQKWFRLGLLNLAIIAFYGMIMRYKILFNFPIFEQQNLLHAHSHFAFSGWITHILYTGLAGLLIPYLPAHKIRRYHLLIGLNICSAFGMLVSFTWQGYQFVSIAFSTISIVIAIAYAIAFNRDKKFMSALHPSRPWAATGLLLNIISALGPFSLAYMMASKHINSSFYLGSIYWYLHFQYSGWFFFGTMALIATHILPAVPDLRKYCRMFSLTVIPTFGLSVLWARLPFWLYIVVVIAAIIQFVAWLMLLQQLFKYFKQKTFVSNTKLFRVFFYAAPLAITLKFTLQTVSVIPALSQLVFGLRPIVIAYLHLVLLGVYSLFIIGYLLYSGYLPLTKMVKYAGLSFLAGVVLNEILLAIQGIAAFSYTPVPYTNGLLLATAVLLFCSAFSLAICSPDNRLKRKPAGS